MAKSKLCSIDGCGKRAVTRELCSAHYHRWQRYGDPLAGSTAKGATWKFLLETVIPLEQDECLAWPYSRTPSGYGQIRHKGRSRRVHRVVCEAIHGPAPTPEHQAAHNCGNGHEGCCNPRHIRWATPAENVADTLLHNTRNRGERHGSAKLNRAQVRQIRDLCGKTPQHEIASRFGISVPTVSDIHRRKLWAWLD